MIHARLCEDLKRLAEETLSKFVHAALSVGVLTSRV